MTRTLKAVGLLGWLTGCNRSAEGTFVGNPNLTAGYDDNAVQRALGGHLEASEVLLRGCDGGPDVSLSNHRFDFVGTDSPDLLQLPEGTYCGLDLQIRELEIRFDEGGPESTTVVGGVFSLAIGDRLRARPGADYRLRLAGRAWLADLAANTVPGENIADDANPALAEAFFTALEEDSGIEQISENPGPDELPGRLNLEGYPVSPNGFPSTETGCGPSVQFDMAVPIPHAAMATLGLGDGEVGWCEGGIQFNIDLSESTAIQIDYSDLSTYPVQYNGWGQGCGALHCDEVVTWEGVPVGRPCTVLVFCDANGEAAATGYSW